MKKRIEKKLSFSKETLRNLSERDMNGVAGGATTTCGGTTSDTCTNDTCASCACSVGCTQLSRCC